MPSEDRLRFDEEDHIAPATQQAAEQDEQHPITGSESRSLHASCQDYELLPKSSIFREKLLPGAGEVASETAHNARPRSR